MYADDTTISYSTVNMEDLVAIVQSELSHLNRWLQANKLSLNVIKTQAMMVGSKQKLSHKKQSYSAIQRSYLETEDIDLVNQTRYLGLIIDDTLQFDSQTKSIQVKISQAPGYFEIRKEICSNCHP